MENNNRPVFESFGDFIKHVYEAKVFEAETGYVGSLVDIITGGMKLKGQSKTLVDTLMAEYLNKYYTDKVKGSKEMADKMKEALSDAFDSLNTEKISTTQGVVTASTLGKTFKYLEAGTVKTEGHPAEAAFITGLEDSSERLSLVELLARINAHNFIVFGELVFEASKSKKSDPWVNGGSSADLKDFEASADKFDKYRFIQIDEKSLDGDTIQMVKFIKNESNPTFPGAFPEYFWQFPLYVAIDIKPGAGNTVDSTVYDNVIEPAGNSVEVTEKVYNSSGTNFFEENAVEISEEGKKAVNAILSQYNSISKIVVNGGASSKPTSRAGGNEKLAKDRQAAGISLLNSLKKSGVAQLKGASVEAGTAKVQDAAPTESDPKNQQVSFVITGMIKSTEVVDKAPVVIEQVEKMKADSVRFKKYTFNIPVDKEPNFKSMSA